MKRQIIFIIGDVHGNFARLNHFIDTKIRKSRALREIAGESEAGAFEVLIFQTGDFAYFWPSMDNLGKIDNRIAFLPDGCCKIYWCGGNHEDWDRIDALFADGDRDIAGLEKGVCCCRFGATLDLADGRTVLFAGGAESPDKRWRLEKMGRGAPKIWWPQEGISKAGMERLSGVKKADILVSHTAPLYFSLTPWLRGNSYDNYEIDNSSREKLNAVFDRFRPKLWYFGHFHKAMRGDFRGCGWFGLPDIADADYGQEVLDIEG